MAAPSKGQLLNLLRNRHVGPRDGLHSAPNTHAGQSFDSEQSSSSHTDGVLSKSAGCELPAQGGLVLQPHLVADRTRAEVIDMESDRGQPSAYRVYNMSFPRLASTHRAIVREAFRLSVGSTDSGPAAAALFEK